YTPGQVSDSLVHDCRAVNNVSLSITDTMIKQYTVPAASLFPSLSVIQPSELSNGCSAAGVEERKRHTWQVV
ncbi:MAG: hypothetical protein WBO14_11290, partial [Gammaproteobacteria bacterium]